MPGAPAQTKRRSLRSASKWSRRMFGKSQPSDASCALNDRAEFAFDAARFTPYIALEREGTIFFLSTESKYGRRLFSTQELKDGRQLGRALRALDSANLRSGRTFIDIGANVGTSTVQALQEHGFAAGVACEADPENFRILKANLAVNGLDGLVYAVNLAVSNRSGEGMLRFRGRGSQTHSLIRDGEAAEDAISVRVTTLDDLAAEIGLSPAAAGLVWVDVEGFELEVLEGARGFLHLAVPLVVEFVPDRYQPLERLQALVEVLSPTYTHFVDLKPSSPSRRTFEPLSAIEALMTRRRDKTDILIVRLSDRVL